MDAMPQAERLPQAIKIVYPRDKYRFLISYQDRVTYERHYEFHEDELIAKEQALSKAPTYDDVMFFELKHTVEVYPEIRDAFFANDIAL